MLADRAVSYAHVTLSLYLLYNHKHDCWRPGMLPLKRLWMRATPSTAMSPVGPVVILMTKTPPTGWRRLRRGWGSSWPGGCPLRSRGFARHLCAAGYLVCALAQAMLGVSGPGMPVFLEYLCRGSLVQVCWGLWGRCVAGLWARYVQSF